MADQHADSQVKEISIDAVIIRADGSREDLGTVSHWKEESNPLRRLVRRVQELKDNA